ncbi:MAG: methyltransferase domain-containing protein [Singulisphaera sp.]
MGPPTILDIGCGRGFDGDVPLQESIAAGRAFIGVEPDPRILLGPYFSATHRCTFEDAPIPANSVHVAFAVMVLEHLADPQRFWDKLWEVLVAGGVFWGLTVDGRHPFCRASLWLEHLRLKDFYLDRLLGRRGAERYENYPVCYRSNTPRQVDRLAARFRHRDYVSFARVGQWSPYLPRPLRPWADAHDRRALRRGRPGTLLAIRVVK